MSKTKKSNIWKKLNTLLMLLLRIVSVFLFSNARFRLSYNFLLISVEFFTGIIMGFFLPRSVQNIKFALLIRKLQFNF